MNKKEYTEFNGRTIEYGDCCHLTQYNYKRNNNNKEDKQMKLDNY